MPRDTEQPLDDAGLSRQFHPLVRRLRDNTIAYTVIAVFVIIAVWVAAINNVLSDRNDRQEFERNRAQELVGMLEQHVIHVMAYADTYLQMARREYLRRGSLEDLQDFLRDAPANPAILSHVTVVSATGKPLFISTGDTIIPSVNAADRDYYKFLRDNPGDPLFVSQSATGRLSGMQTIRFARRVEMQTGQFDGLIFTSIRIDHLTKPFQSLNLGRHSVVGLVGLDGKIRVWSQQGDTSIPDFSTNDWPIWPNMDQNPTGNFNTAATSDGIKRNFAYQRVKNYPLVAVIGIAGADIIATTLTHTWSTISVALLVTLIIIVMTSSIQRDVRLMRALKGEIKVRRRAESEAIHATEIKTAFLATMSHEIRTPINAIMGLFELIEQADIPERQIRQARAGQTAAGDLFKQLTNVLDASRLEAKSMDLTLRPEPLAPMIADLTQLLEAAIKASGKPILSDAQVSGDVPTSIHIDRRRVEQIMLNFIDNAVKFTEAGRIYLDVSVDRSGPTPELCFAVCDTGPGMSPTDQKHLFKRFSQLDSAITRRAGGAGLGLSISKDLAELMHARLKVNSQTGNGSCFCLLLRIDNLST